MANYQTIYHQRETVQLDVPETPTDMPLKILVDNEDFPVYRDQSGFYILVNTKNGTQRANEGQWAVLMSAKVPSTPTIPNVQATGSFTIAGVADGDGEVGFSYNGNEYKVSPASGQTEDNTAANLAAIVNASFDIRAIVVGNILTISSINLQGTAGNLPLVDVSTDSTQGGTPIGLSGGVDFSPGTPEIPAIFEIYNDGDFQDVYELVP